MKCTKSSMDTYLACIYGKSTHKVYRLKIPNQEHPEIILSPVHLDSIDQFLSPTPWFIAHMADKLTKNRYKYTGIFVDQASKLGYIYFEKKSTMEETLEVKKWFQ